jgi:hypothetical protein
MQDNNYEVDLHAVQGKTSVPPPCVTFSPSLHPCVHWAPADMAGTEWTLQFSCLQINMKKLAISETYED